MLLVQKELIKIFSRKNLVILLEISYNIFLEFCMREYRDYFFKKAKSENYPARSVYKLKEIDAKYHILKAANKVLDLGAAPGSWSLGAAEKVGKSGLVFACDIQAVNRAFPPQVRFFQEDIFQPSASFIEELKANFPFDLVMSDMAPATTGSRFTDQARSLELAQAAFEFAQQYLCTGGAFVVKIFMGPDINELLLPMRKTFNSVKSFKPKSSRSESKETFFIGLDFKKAEAPDTDS